MTWISRRYAGDDTDTHKHQNRPTLQVIDNPAKRLVEYKFSLRNISMGNFIHNNSCVAILEAKFTFILFSFINLGLGHLSPFSYVTFAEGQRVHYCN